MSEWIKAWLRPAVRLLRGGSPADQCRFLSQWRAFARMPGAASPRWSDLLPILGEWTATTAYDRHYVLHTAWAARVLAQTRPALHVDISSSLYFCALVSAFVPVEFYDYRPADMRLSNLTSRSADLLALPFADRSVASISCMHVVEHIGLGRYGDPLDPGGDVKAMTQLQRVLAPGGSLLIVVPVGRPRVQFNAHRIYSHAMIVQAFAELRLKATALIPDDPAEGSLIDQPTPAQMDRQTYGCGCFWFERP
jgi:SAM-dependent methyltransferase